MTVVLPLAIDLSIILACLVAVGIIMVAIYFAEALLSIVKHTAGKIPFLDKFVDKGVTWVEQVIVAKMSDAANDVQGVVGAFWHAAGNMLTSMGNEILGLAQAINQFGVYMHTVVRPWVVHSTLDHVLGKQKADDARSKANTRDANRLRKALWGLAGALGGLNLGAWLKRIDGGHAHTQKQVQALQHGYAHPGVYPRAGVDKPAREWAREAEQRVENLWDQVKGIGKVVTWPLSGALVVTAVARLGGGWIFCRNWASPKRGVGRAICRMPGHWLDDVLGLLADFAIITNICTVLPWLEEGVSFAAAPLIEGLSVVGAGICHGSNGKAVSLQVPQLYRVPVAGYSQLHLP